MIKLILLMILLVMIFYLSHQSGSASLELSDGILYRIMSYFIEEPYLYFDKKTIDFFSLILRQSAHFCEFGLLGLLIILNLEEYLNNSIAEFTNKIIAEYGQDLKTVIDNVLLIKEKIAELSTIEYTDPEFEIKHKKIAPIQGYF